MHRPESHAHQPADDDAARRPPMTHLRRARCAHGDVQPVIEALAVLCLGAQDGHRLPFAIGGGAKFLDQCLRERAAHPQHVVDGESVHALRNPMRPRSVVGEDFQAAVHRRHRLNRKPAARGARQIQMLRGARSRRMQIERLAGRAVKQQHVQFLDLRRVQAYRTPVERDAVAPRTASRRAPGLRR